VGQSVSGLPASIVGETGVNSEHDGHSGRGLSPRLRTFVSRSAAISCVRAPLITGNSAGSAFASHCPTLRPTSCVEIRANIHRQREETPAQPATPSPWDATPVTAQSSTSRHHARPNFPVDKHDPSGGRSLQNKPISPGEDETLHLRSYLAATRHDEDA
jgi:hypothetical protein